VILAGFRWRCTHGYSRSFKTAYMEPSNECPFSRPPRSSFDSSNRFHSLDSPTPVQRELAGSTSANDPTGGTSNTFVENLRSKLVSLPIQGESKRADEIKRDYRRRSYRFSPHSRSRSLCSISIESRSSVRRRASPNGIQKTLSTDQRLYACKVPLTRGMSPLVENMQVIATPVPDRLPKCLTE